MTQIITTSGGTNLTKSLMQSRKDHILQSVRNGNSNALSVFMQCKFIAETMKVAMEDLKQSAMDHASLYMKGDRKLLGVAFDLKDGVGTPDYMADPEYARLHAALEARKELLKQAAKGKGETMDPDTSEVIPKVPMKYAEASIAITFPK